MSTPSAVTPMHTDDPEVQDARRSEVENKCVELRSRLQIAERVLGDAAGNPGKPLDDMEARLLLDAAKDVREGLGEIVQIVYGKRDEELPS